MKKFLVFVLVAILMLGVVSNAMAAKVGDLVSVNISVKSNPNNAYAGGISCNYDKTALEFVSAESKSSDVLFVPTASNSGISLLNTSGITTGVKVTITFRIKPEAEAKTYSVSASGYDFVDIDENSVSVSVSGGSVTVEADACTHTWDNGTETTSAGCETAGVKTYTCTQCGETKTETIVAKGHTTANGETVNPTCTQDGYTTGVCSVCGKELDKQVLPATGHKSDGGKETKAATCNEKGVKTHTCTVCQTVIKTEEIAALGHKSDGGKETKAATCTEKGVKTHTCTVCQTVIKTEEIAALGHKSDGGKETKAATCTEKGVKTHTCTVCQTVIKTEEIAALGHKPGDWVVVKEATNEADGLKEKYCKVCNAVVDSASVPYAQWKNRKVTTSGIRFRDESEVTDQWYMFTPVDLSVEGEQTIDLIAAGKHIIGTVFVNVADGQVTVTYEASKRVVMKNDFLTFFKDIASVTTLEEEQLTGYTFGEPISIDEQLDGDTKVLLYFSGLALYRDDARGLGSFAYSVEANKQYLEELRSLMD